ncbi:hypothetical protein [Brucella endophytica]|nr:hypothetical protein [Brucella endophytica]
MLTVRVRTLPTMLLLPLVVNSPMTAMICSFRFVRAAPIAASMMV